MMHVRSPHTVRGLLVNSLYSELMEQNNPTLQYWLIKAMKIVTLNKNDYLRGFTGTNDQKSADSFTNGLVSFMNGIKNKYIQNTQLCYADFVAHITYYKFVNVDFSRLRPENINFFRFLLARIDVHGIISFKIQSSQNSMLCLQDANQHQHIVVGVKTSDIDFHLFEKQQLNIICVQGDKNDNFNDLQTQLEGINDIKALVLFGVQNKSEGRKTFVQRFFDIKIQERCFNKLVTLSLVQCSYPELKRFGTLLNVSLCHVMNVKDEDLKYFKVIKRIYVLSSTVQGGEGWENAISTLLGAEGSKDLVRAQFVECQINNSLQLRIAFLRLSILEIVAKTGEGQQKNQQQQKLQITLTIDSKCMPSLEFLHTNLQVINMKDLQHVPFIVIQ